MRSTQSRLAVALALFLATAPVSIDLDGQAEGIGDPQLMRLISPALPAWADDEFELEDVGKVKRGEKDVVVRADVGKSGLICTVKVKYPDGDTDTFDETESDRKGICEVSFDVPDRKSVVGDATVKLKVETRKGTDLGKASRNFSIRDRRGF